MLENDDLNEFPPHENLLNGEKRPNSCINQQTYNIINEKKNFLTKLKAQREEQLINFEENNRSILYKQELITSIMHRKMNINCLNQELSNCDERIRTNNEELDSIRKRIEKKKQIISLYKDKIEKCKEMVKKSENTTYNKTNNEKDGFNILKLRLIEYEKQRIDELNKYVFNLTEMKQKDDDNLQKSTQTALKDARQTVYVNGRWILANDHVIYRIIRSILPSDGDYLSYLKDSLEKDNKLKDDSHHLADIDRHYNQAHSNSPNSNRSSLLWGGTSQYSANSNNTSLSATSRSFDRNMILSGLTYTVQFVNLIAFYLNIVLPYNLPHNKFCMQSDSQLQNAVAKLNTNIVYLSINQHIPVTNLLPKHTLENLNHFLTYFKEMRIKLREKHSISFPIHMIPLLNEMFTDSDEDNYIQDSMPNMILYRDDNDDWETVPNSNQIPSDDTYNPNPTPRVASSSLISSVLSHIWFKK